MNLHKIHSYIPLVGAVASGLGLLFIGLTWSYKPPAVTEAGSKKIFSVEYAQTLPSLERIYSLTDNDTAKEYTVIENDKSVAITPRLSKGVGEK